MVVFRLEFFIIILALALFILPRPAEASTPLQTVTSGLDGGLPASVSQNRWLLTVEALVRTADEVRRPVAEESRESRRIHGGLAAGEIVPLQLPRTSAPLVIVFRPSLCASASPGFVPRL